MDMFALKSIRAILRSIIHQEVTHVQVLVMRQDQTLVRRLAKVALHPDQLV